ncbi:MAG: hypothetical protein ACKO6N_11340 [Myxococcota bacterium]
MMRSHRQKRTGIAAEELMPQALERARETLDKLTDSANLSLTETLATIPTLAATGNLPPSILLGLGVFDACATTLKATIAVTLQLCDASTANPISTEVVDRFARLSKKLIKLGELPILMPQVQLGLAAVTQGVAMTAVVTAPEPPARATAAQVQAQAIFLAVQNAPTQASFEHGLGAMLSALSICIAEAALSLKLTAQDAYTQMNAHRRYDRYGRSERYDAEEMVAAAAAAAAAAAGTGTSTSGAGGAVSTPPVTPPAGPPPSP